MQIESYGTEDARTTVWEWDSVFHVPTRIVHGDRETRLSYDEQGNLTELKVAGQVRFKVQYNANGQPLIIDGARDDIDDLTYFRYADETSNLLEFENALGHVYKMSDYTTEGKPQTIIDPNGLATNYRYDSRGFVEKIIQYSDDESLTTSIKYDGVGQITFFRSRSGIELFLSYDDSHRLKSLSNSLNERVDFEYDAAGNVLRINTYDFSSNLVMQVNSTYDELSRLMKTAGAAQSLVKEYQYDINNRLTKSVDGKGNTTDYTYDALDRLISTIDPLLAETQTESDAFNRLTKVTDAEGVVTEYVYDAFDNLTQLSSADTGETNFVYDEANNLIQQTDARGVVVDYTYDALNRLTHVVFPGDTSENITYTYDETAGGNYGIGRLTRIDDASGSITFNYDFLGNLTQKKVTIQDQQFITQHAYNGVGQLESTTYPSGRVVHYTLDGLGRIEALSTQASLLAPMDSVISETDYLPFGPMQSFVYGNGISKTLTFDTNYRLVEQSDSGNSLGFNRTYEYDANGNIGSITYTGDSALDQLFSYDLVDRLERAEGAYGVFDYLYDGVGNRTERKHTEGGATNIENYVYAADSHRLQTVNNGQSTRSFTYDAAGNAISDNKDGQTTSYAYNQTSRPAQADTPTQTVTYLYNSLGQRTVKDNGTNVTYFLYDEGGQLLAEVDEHGRYLQENIWLYNNLVGVIKDTPETDRYYLVHKGTNRRAATCETEVDLPITLAWTGETSRCAQWHKLTRDNGYYHIQNAHNGFFAAPGSQWDGAWIKAQPNTWRGDYTQWMFTETDNGYGLIKHRTTGKHVYTAGSFGDELVLQPNTWTGDWAQWKFELVEQ